MKIGASVLIGRLLSAARRDLAFINPLFWPPRSNFYLWRFSHEFNHSCRSNRTRPRFETWRTNRKYVREPILRSMPLGGESEQSFFAFFTLRPLPQAHLEFGR